ncbi:MAG: septum formation initiator family protein [Bryobacteraceae bacterium]|jgi:cell division protein FtsB
MKQAVLRWAGTLALAGCMALFFALRVPHGISALEDKHQQIRQLEQQNADLAKDNAAKRDRIHKLRESRSEQELEVRKRLKLQREGETSILPDPAKK